MRRFLMSAVFITVILATVVLAHDPISGKNDGMERGIQQWRRLERLGPELGLSEQQIDRMRSVMTQSAKDLADLKAEEHKAEIDFDMLLDNPEASSAEIEKAFRKVQEHEQMLQLTKMRTILSIRDVLTPEQRAEMKEIITQRRAEKRGHRYEKQNRWDHKSECQKHMGPPYGGPPCHRGTGNMKYLPAP